MMFCTTKDTKITKKDSKKLFVAFVFFVVLYVVRL